MKKFLVVMVCAVGMVFSLSATSSAAYWSDYDSFNYRLTEGNSAFWHELNIAVEDTFNPGFDTVTSARAWLYFDDDDNDNNGYREYGYVWVEGSGWSPTGEIDDGWRNFAVNAAGLSSLNFDGQLSVGVYSNANQNGIGDFFWKGAKLEAWGTAAPVPEPATMLLFGLGLLGLAGVSRKKREK